MGNRVRKGQSGPYWYWTSLERPLTDAQRHRLQALFASAGKGGGVKGDLRLLAHALRGYALYRQYGLAPTALQWQATKEGRPYLPAYPEIDANLSHSGHMAVCGVGNAFVGVDIQKRIPSVSWALAQRVCSQEELLWLQGKEASQRADAFIGLWALKESYLKWNGKGLSYGMRSFSAYERTPGEIETSLKGMRFSLCTPLPGYRAALCTQGSPAQDIRPVAQAQVLCFCADWHENTAEPLDK